MLLCVSPASRLLRKPRSASEFGEKPVADKPDVTLPSAKTLVKLPVRSQPPDFGIGHLVNPIIVV